MVTNSIFKETSSVVASVPSNGNGFLWENGYQFASVNEQYNSLKKGVGLRKISEKGITEVKGADALDYIHRISTNSVKNLEKNFFERTIFTTEKGRIIDRVGIINFGDTLLLLGSSANQTKVSSWIRKYIIQDDVKVCNYDSRFCFFELCGVQADSFIRLIVGNEINKIELNQFKEYFVEEMHLYILKLKDGLGNYKFGIFSSPVYAKKMVSFMLENKGVFDFNLISDEAYESYRIESGIPKAPNELNDQYNPLEVNLTEELCAKKGCYVGQEVIARLDTYDKVQRCLCSVHFENDIDTSGRFILYDANSEPVGEITSITKHPVNNKIIGLAIIKKASFKPGEKMKAKSEFTTTNVDLLKLPGRK